MEKGSKFTDCSKYNEVPVCGTQLSFPQRSLKLRAPSEATILGSKNAETKLVSKAALRKKRKQKSKNVHLKAVTTKSHLEINARGRSPSTQKTLKAKKQETRNANFRDIRTAGKPVINGQKNSSTLGRVSLQSKALLKAWPSRSYNSTKDCSEVMVKRNKLFKHRLLNKSINTHRCFDFASGSTVQACCLSSDCGLWVSTDPCIRSHAKYKQVNPRMIVDQKDIRKASPKTVLAPSTSNETSQHVEVSRCSCSFCVKKLCGNK